MTERSADIAPQPNRPGRSGRPRGRRGGARRGAGGEVYAALDLGTNNCRLLVAKPVGGGFRVIDSFSRITRLGEGLTANGALSEAAMARTVAALNVCAAKMRRRRVTRARIVATEACRRATNGAAFVDRVAAQTGLALEVIGHDEEVRLAAAGCESLLRDDADHALVFDIGGGSTELAALDLSAAAPPRLAEWVSLPVGVVNLAERHRGGEATAYAGMKAEVVAMARQFEARAGLAPRIGGDDLQMIGTSGTVTTVAAVHLDLPRYDRARVDGSDMEFDDIATVTARLRRMNLAERTAHPCVLAERADLVIAGCAILEAICDTWPVGRLRVADRGLREGILLSLMGLGAP